MRTVLREAKCLLRCFFEVARKSRREVRTPDTEDHTVGEEPDLGRTEEESDI